LPANDSAFRQAFRAYAKHLLLGEALNNCLSPYKNPTDREEGFPDFRISISPYLDSTEQVQPVMDIIKVTMQRSRFSRIFSGYPRSSGQSGVWTPPIRSPKLSKMMNPLPPIAGRKTRTLESRLREQRKKGGLSRACLMPSHHPSNQTRCVHGQKKNHGLFTGTRFSQVVVRELPHLGRGQSQIPSPTECIVPCLVVCGC
jgi:hypothetical protein